jgi:hypothetical protein
LRELDEPHEQGRRPIVRSVDPNAGDSKKTRLRAFAPECRALLQKNQV